MGCAILCKPGWHAVIFIMLQEPQIYCPGDTAMQGHAGYTGTKPCGGYNQNGYLETVSSVEIFWGHKTRTRQGNSRGSHSKFCGTYHID